MAPATLAQPRSRAPLAPLHPPPETPPRKLPQPPDSSVAHSGTCLATASLPSSPPGFPRPRSAHKSVIPSSPDRSQHGPWLVSFSACALSAFTLEPRFTVSSCGRRPATSSNLGELGVGYSPCGDAALAPRAGQGNTRGDKFGVLERGV